jgi:hypothetical protein
MNQQQGYATAVILIEDADSVRLHVAPARGNGSIRRHVGFLLFRLTLKKAQYSSMIGPGMEDGNCLLALPPNQV